MKLKMMNQEKQYIKIAKLIASELNSSINVEDQKYLDNWLNESKENKNIYNDIKRDGWYQSNLRTHNAYKTEEGWNIVNTRIQSTSKIIKLTPSFLKYAVAAVFIGVLTTTYFFRDNFISTPQELPPTIVNTNTIEVGTDKAILTLEDGSVVALEKGNAYQSQNANSNGEEIVYGKSQVNSKKIAYNYLTIPKGGQFQITLSDGTQVWLNSDSQLKYPINFIKYQTREVELVYGEAYFDVTPSSENSGTMFKVVNKSQEIDVLGTEFNVKAYNDEDRVYTTLVEGKVDLNINGKKFSLSPNEQSELNINTNSISFAEVDVYNETSWKDGIFSFDGLNMKSIMKVLSRWYDVEFIFKNEPVMEKEFVGIIRKNKNLEDILNNIKNFGVIENFIIEEKTVILE